MMRTTLGFGPAGAADFLSCPVAEAAAAAAMADPSRNFRRLSGLVLVEGASGRGAVTIPVYFAIGIPENWRQIGFQSGTL